MSLSLGGSGGGKPACSSTEYVNSIPITEKSMQYYLYPPPIAQYEDVIASPKLFMDILGKFHAAMGTKFKIPIVGGRDLDLHRLFMEVTSRGGIKRVLEDKKWREVTNCFCFPPSATNASFILRKYYMSLVHHFEQVYYFKAKAWTPVPTDTWQSTTTTLTSTSGMNKGVLPLPEAHVTSVKRQRTITEQLLLTKGTVESSIGLPVTGIIDGKFESGYLCTVKIGGEQLQGVLYQTVQQTSVNEIPNHGGGDVTMVKRRRRRRKKSEMRKRDPAHPKPNRSGYNFFFAEQHARLKLLHTTKDRAISRMIGEEWNKLNDAQKAIYQEKAVIDKERYRSEMEHYREGLSTGQILTNARPLQHQYYMVDTSMIPVENNSQQIHENSGFSDDENSSFEEQNLQMKTKEEEMLFGESKKSIDDQSVFLDGSGQQKSMFVQENEPVFDENESKQDETMIPDMHDGNDTKSVDNQEKDLVNFDGLVGIRPVVNDEEKVVEDHPNGAE